MRERGRRRNGDPSSSVSVSYRLDGVREGGSACVCVSERAIKGGREKEEERGRQREGEREPGEDREGGR